MTKQLMRKLTYWQQVKGIIRTEHVYIFFSYVKSISSIMVSLILVESLTAGELLGPVAIKLSVLICYGDFHMELYDICLFFAPVFSIFI